MSGHPRVRHPGPGIVEIEEGGGWLTFFGTTFLVAAVIFFLAALDVIPMTGTEGLGRWAGALAGGMGIVSSALGVALTLGRRWTLLDVRRGKLLLRWGPLVPMFRKEHRLGAYDAVRLVLVPGDSEPSDTYPVTLRPRGRAAPVTLATGSDYAGARGVAAEVARALDLPLVDATAGPGVEIPASAVEATLQDRLREGLEPLPEGARPPAAMSRVEAKRGGVAIELPGPRFHRGLARLRSGRGGTTIEVSESGLTIEERGLWRTRTTTIHARDILGLVVGTGDEPRRETRGKALVPGSGSGAVQTRSQREGREPAWLKALFRMLPSDGVIVQTRDGLVPIGAGLSDEEVRWLRALVARALAGEAAE